MNQTHIYTEYHPRWYRKRVSTYWWTRQFGYLKFILRELSCLGVAYFVVLMLVLLNSLRGGATAYAEFQALMQMPLMIVLNVVALFLTLFHTITWFNLAPRAMVVYFGKKRVPDLLIALPNYIAWLTVSAAICWFLLGGKW